MLHEASATAIVVGVRRPTHARNHLAGPLSSGFLHQRLLHGLFIQTRELEGVHGRYLPEVMWAGSTSDLSDTRATHGWRLCFSCTGKDVVYIVVRRQNDVVQSASANPLQKFFAREIKDRL